MTASVGGPGQAGWFADPMQRFELRYWDGRQWTQAVMRDGTAGTDPDFRPGAPPDVRAAGAPPAAVQRAGPPQPGVVGGSVRERPTSLPIGEAQDRICQMLAMAGYPPTQVSQGRVDTTVTIKPEPNGILLVVLIVFCLLPGIIYWYVASRPVHHQVSVYLVPSGQGTQVTVHGNPDALAQLGSVFDRLPW